MVLDEYYGINGHLRNRLIGGTNSIYFWPMFQAYVREYPHQNMA